MPNIMQDTTKENFEPGMYQRGKYPSIIDTDDLVFEIGVLSAGNINKEKLLDKLIQDNKTIQIQIQNLEKEKSETAPKVQQALESNKLYEKNNRALDQELTKLRNSNHILTNELTDAQNVINILQTDLEAMNKEMSSLESVIQKIKSKSKPSSKR